MSDKKYTIEFYIEGEEDFIPITHNGEELEACRTVHEVFVRGIHAKLKEDQSRTYFYPPHRIREAIMVENE